MTKRALYLLLPVIFLALFYFYPLFAIMRLSFAPTGTLDLTALSELVSSSYYLKTLWFTLWQAILSTILTVVVALPGAYVFATYRFRGKTLLQALTTIPFVLPTIVVANAFTALIGPRGLLNSAAMSLFDLHEPPIVIQRTTTLIILAHVFYNYTIVLRLVGGFWANLDPRLSEAAQMLGCTPWQAFRRVTLPLLLPIIMAAALLVFIFCFTSFGVILILGGPRYATLEVEIYRQAVNLFNLPIAAALSLVQIGSMFGLMLLYNYLQARTTRPLNLLSSQITQHPPRTWREWLMVWGNITFMLLLLGSPLAALVARSLTVEGQFSWLYYQTLLSSHAPNGWLVPPSAAIGNSLIFATATVIGALMLGLMVALTLTQPKQKGTTLLEALVMLPLVTSAVTLGFGYTVSMGQPPFNWFELRTSPILVIIAHTLVALPFVIRAILPALRTIQPNLHEAAAILGATPRQVWWQVDWPIIRRALLVGAVFAFTVSMGEFGATVFIARPNMPTIPTAIFRLLDKPGQLNYGQALALSSLLMLLCTLAFILIERFRIGKQQEF